MILVPAPGGAAAADLAQPSIFLIDTPIRTASRRRRSAARLAEARSLEGLVPPLVAAHIATHHLISIGECRSDQRAEWAAQGVA